MVQVSLFEVPELVHAGSVAGSKTLGVFNHAADAGFLACGVLRGLGVDLDDADTWVVGATVVLACEIANIYVRIQWVKEREVSKRAGLEVKGGIYRRRGHQSRP